MTERRRFIAKATGAVVTVAAAGIIDAPNVMLNQRSTGGCRRHGHRRSTRTKA